MASPVNDRNRSPAGDQSDGARVYVTNACSGSTSVINASTLTVTKTIATSSGRGVAITLNGARAYVTNTASSSVSVIDTATNKVTATIPVGGGPEGVAITPYGDHVYVTATKAGGVAVIDTSTNTVTKTVDRVGLAPVGVAIG
ncbi:DUF5074 domain-containing protein [Actinoallomurus sp. NPDC050550]|uniref:YncE family protein n=1 Tax=Actinoallomurus sp. NPDC050550 TaxID=3154937 RepID=UPI0033D58D55